MTLFDFTGEGSHKNITKFQTNTLIGWAMNRSGMKRSDFEKIRQDISACREWARGNINFLISAAKETGYV